MVEGQPGEQGQTKEGALIDARTEASIESSEVLQPEQIRQELHEELSTWVSELTDSLESLDNILKVHSPEYKRYRSDQPNALAADLVLDYEDSRKQALLGMIMKYDQGGGYKMDAMGTDHFHEMEGVQQTLNRLNRIQRLTKQLRG